MQTLQQDERVAAAKELQANPLFRSLIAGLQERSLQELRAAPIGDLTATSAHARIKALDEIVAELTSIITNEKFSGNRR